MSDVTETLTPLSKTVNVVSRSLPIREDCWSEEATATLIEAWGRRYLEVNRGNLRQKDWQDVANTVNALHGHTKKTHRSDVQCKNRIDTIKKKYKIEKARVSSSNGAVSSSWRFFEILDKLIGSNAVPAKKQPPSMSPSPSPPLALPLRRTPNSAPPPLAIVALPQKRPIDDGDYRKNYSFYRSSMAAAAAAAEQVTDSEEEEEEDVPLVRRESEEAGEGEREGEGLKRLARAIERFGEVYERVESEKLTQMMDMEKQRLKFEKELEMERMKIFTETRIQLEKIKKGKHQSGANGERDY